MVDQAIQHSSLTVPERGVRRRFVGFSTRLEYVLAAGLLVLFTVGVAVEGYLQDLLADQVRLAFLWLFAGIVLALVRIDPARTRPRRAIRNVLIGLGLAGLAWSAGWLMPGSITMIGVAHVAVRLVVYAGLGAVGFWAWGCWVWAYAQVWLLRGAPGEDGGPPGRDSRPGRRALRRLGELLPQVPDPSWRQARFDIRGSLADAWRAKFSARGLVAVARELRAPVRCVLASLWQTGINAMHLVATALDEGVARDIGFAVLDPLFVYPSEIRTARLHRLLAVAGHRIVDEHHTAEGAEYDQRRLSCVKNLLVGLTLALICAGMLELHGCRHETPRGILGGTGDRIAKGRVPVQRKRSKEQKKKKKKEKKTKERIVRQSMLKLFKDQMKDLAEEASIAQEAGITGDAGLPDGHGSGPTAAGSPKGTAIGGKYWLYRVKYRGGNWRANRKGVPALMREFTRAVNVKTNKYDQPVTLGDLPRHSEKYFPVLLYITGNGRIGVNSREAENLRNYLLAGGFLFADCSGGDFHNHFFDLMKRVFPDRRFRRIAYDHTIFRGDYMPWLMRDGCPVYRQHYGAGDARGLFLERRLAVFYSGGDLGAAWASVGWAKAKRKDVELAFRMGVNIISYAMLYGGEQGFPLADEKGPD